jgi:hypothetical protein
LLKSDHFNFVLTVRNDDLKVGIGAFHLITSLTHPPEDTTADIWAHTTSTICAGRRAECCDNTITSFINSDIKVLKRKENEREKERERKQYGSCSEGPSNRRHIHTGGSHYTRHSSRKAHIVLKYFKIKMKKHCEDKYTKERLTKVTSRPSP